MALPMTGWNYISQDDKIRHIGPMAQDFYAAFGLGHTDKGIATIDADGVSLAAIQGLNNKLKNEIQQQDGEIKGLKKRLEAIEALLMKSQK